MNQSRGPSAKTANLLCFPISSWYYQCHNVACYWQVLDMCAAPGSKTAQLIEMLHAAEVDSQPGSTLGDFTFWISLSLSLFAQSKD